MYPVLSWARRDTNISHTWATFVFDMHLSSRDTKNISHLGSFCIQYPAELQGIQISLTLGQLLYPISSWVTRDTNIFHTWATFVSNMQLSYKEYKYILRLGNICIHYSAEQQGIQIFLTILTFVSNIMLSYKGYKYLSHFKHLYPIFNWATRDTNISHTWATVVSNMQMSY